jgi:hypothetical protein
MWRAKIFRDNRIIMAVSSETAIFFFVNFSFVNCPLIVKLLPAGSLAMCDAPSLPGFFLREQREKNGRILLRKP